MYQILQVFSLLALFVFMNSVCAFEVNSQDLKKNLDQVQLNKGHVSQMLDVLVAKGKITPQQGEKARKELEDMSEEQMQELTQRAVQQIQKTSEEEDASSLEDYLKGMSP